MLICLFRSIILNLNHYSKWWSNWRQKKLKIVHCSVSFIYCLFIWTAQFHYYHSRREVDALNIHIILNKPCIWLIENQIKKLFLFTYILTTTKTQLFSIIYFYLENQIECILLHNYNVYFMHGISIRHTIQNQWISDGWNRRKDKFSNGMVTSCVQQIFEPTEQTFGELYKAPFSWKRRGSAIQAKNIRRTWWGMGAVNCEASKFKLKLKLHLNFQTYSLFRH